MVSGLILAHIMEEYRGWSTKPTKNQKYKLMKTEIFEIISPLDPQYKTYAQMHNLN